MQQEQEAIEPDDDGEQILQRVAAIDVAKSSGMVCVRVPHESNPQKRVNRIWQASATMNDIVQTADRLKQAGIERVVLESTSDYWRPWFYMFETLGLRVWLVNSRDVKNVPGRAKTDKLDAVWLAKLNERGMLRPSFVPAAPVRQLRDYTRLRSDLVADRTRVKQRLEKLLEDALIKLSSVLSDIFGVSGRAIMSALIAVERDPGTLADHADRRVITRGKRPALIEALTGRFDQHHAELTRMLLGQVDTLTGDIARLDERVDQLITALPMNQATQQSHSEPTAAPTSSEPNDAGAPSPTGPSGLVDRLAEIPGISRTAAQIIIAEVGTNVDRFPTAGHLTSWAKLTPRTIQSGSKRASGKTGKGNRYLKSVLGNAAATAAKTNTFIGERYRRLIKRRGKLKTLVATARTILVAIWHLLADPTTRYTDLGADYYTNHINKQRKTRNLIHQLEVLGLEVTVRPTA